mmetsp:Transcript_52367/g.131557  ORF Transcript_52367/g.131557 Transcript_52367/m.131557 type:complete len:227 (+) Transcript_52367:1236-1916(+)
MRRSPLSSASLHPVASSPVHPAAAAASATIRSRASAVNSTALIEHTSTAPLVLGLLPRTPVPPQNPLPFDHLTTEHIMETPTKHHPIGSVVIFIRIRIRIATTGTILSHDLSRRTMNVNRNEPAPTAAVVPPRVGTAAVASLAGSTTRRRCSSWPLFHRANCRPRSRSQRPIRGWSTSTPISVCRRRAPLVHLASTPPFSPSAGVPPPTDASGPIGCSVRWTTASR